MEYLLKNGKKVVIRTPVEGDAENLIALITAVDGETPFLVLADYCDMGIGGRLMEECLRWCRENQITQVELGVVTTNERAFAMYKNFGFEVMGTIPNALRYLDGTSVDEYQMVKFL